MCTKFNNTLAISTAIYRITVDALTQIDKKQLQANEIRIYNVLST